MTRKVRMPVSLALVLVVAGCTATPASEGPSRVTSPPTATSTPIPSATAGPSPSASTNPSPSSGPIAWSSPKLLFGGVCGAPALTIDDSGRMHVAASCDGAIRYVTSDDGVDWMASSIVPGIDVLEVDPELTVDGDTLHLAFTRLRADGGGCGPAEMRLGVIHQSLRPGAGDWSRQDQIGEESDRLESFRVVGGVVHATVKADDRTFYVSRTGDSVARIEIPSTGRTSLRVGDDGRPRIAYSTGKELRIGLVDAGSLTTLTMATVEDTNILDPQLVLAPGDHPYVAWTQFHGSRGGCVTIDPGPEDGTWFGSDSQGSWSIERITSDGALSRPSLTLDPTTGDVHLLVNDRSRQHYRSNADGSWTVSELSDLVRLGSPVIRLSSVTGRLVIVGMDNAGLQVVVGNPGRS